MKKALFISFILLLCAAISANAVVRTVSNRNDIRAQYNSIQAAIGASSTGDVIYVQPSQTSYGDFSLDRALSIIGGGYNPDHSNGFITTCNTITFNNGSNGSLVEGFYCSHITKTYNHNVSNITIRNCNINTIYIDLYNNSYFANNWKIYNNIIRTSLTIDNRSNNNTNHIISNNIFSGNTPSIINSSHSSIIIKHNIFTGCSNCDAFQNVTNATISDNIFFGKSPAGASTSSFINNLTYLTNQNQLPYGDNLGLGNIINQNPMFNNAPNRENYNYTYNYNLLSNSPCLNAGSDSTDIGITGGEYPFPNHINGFPDYSGQPPIPLIKTFTIINKVLNQNGILRFNVNAVKKD